MSTANPFIIRTLDSPFIILQSEIPFSWIPHSVLDHNSRRLKTCHHFERCAPCCPELLNLVFLRVVCSIRSTTIVISNFSTWKGTIFFVLLPKKILKVYHQSRSSSFVPRTSKKPCYYYKVLFRTKKQQLCQFQSKWHN